MNNLAICYENGEGVEIDINNAVKLYKKSASLGNMDAQVKIASIITKIMSKINKKMPNVFYHFV